MDHQRNSLRIGAAVILCALFLRLWAGGLYQKVADLLSDPTIQSFLIYLETGRNVRFSPSLEETSDPVGESPAPVLWQPLVETSARPSFMAADMDLIDITYSCSLRPDLEKLLTAPLEWDLTGDGPTVLILHTHTTESYTKDGEVYEETSAFRTLDENYNMLSIGDRVTEILTQNGIAVLHDRETHDYPSYNGSYVDARESIQSILEKYPSIRLVLDLHRDASGDLNNQIRPLATVDGENSAQLMLVMGTNVSSSHPDWEQNLALGLKLHAQLERIAPGITRPISLRSSRFNQDLTHGSLLIEVGAAGNTHDEALRAAEILAKAIVALSRGTE